MTEIELRNQNNVNQHADELNPGGSPLEIAIIGMSALFPKAPSLGDYWQNIVDKVDGVTEASEAWIQPYYDPESGEVNRLYNNRCGFLGDLAKFNPMEFGIMPNSVDGGSPDQFLVLKLAKEALVDAGYWDKPFNREKTGIIVGHGTFFDHGFNTLLQHGLIIDQTMAILENLNPDFTPETLEKIRGKLKESLPTLTAEKVPALVPNVISGRIANRLNLMGPNYIVDAACSSALIVVDLAVKELQTGRCDMVLAGSAQVSNTPQLNMLFSLIGAMSHTLVRPFDEEGDGMLIGEGVGMMVLKRLRDAEKDGDRIYAVIKGIGISSDGKALGLLAPRLEGEVLALKRAYQHYNIDPDTVSLIEAHGTGITLGDTTEIDCLKSIYGERRGKLPHRALGSVKSMIGHCLPAAGSAGLIKAVLALYHKVLPPTLCNKTNPDIGIENSQFYVNNQTRPWINGNPASPRRAGINAFGFGGTNAHVIVEEYQHPQDSIPKSLFKKQPSELLNFSGDNSAELTGFIEKIKNLLNSTPEVNLSDLAYSVWNRGLNPGKIRLAMVAKDIEDLKVKLELALKVVKDEGKSNIPARSGVYYAAQPSTGKTAFLFTGQGAQYPNMLADMCLYFPGVRGWFDFIDEVYAHKSEYPPSLLIFPPPMLSPEESEWIIRQLFKYDIALVTLFFSTMALYELLTRMNIGCDCMVGHSTGDIFAQAASNTIIMENREVMAAGLMEFNRLYNEMEAAGKIPQGVILSVGAVEPEKLRGIVDSYGEKAHLALDNCPNQVMLVGEEKEMAEVRERLEGLGGICERMPFDFAYHTPMFREVARHMCVNYDDFAYGERTSTVYSCCSAEPIPESAGEVRELSERQWHSRVRFRETIENLYRDGVRTFIEVGPSGNLTAFVKDTLQNRPHTAVSCDNQRKPGLEQFHRMLAQLFVNGADINFEPLFENRTLNFLNIDEPRIDRGKPIPVIDLVVPQMRLEKQDAERILDLKGDGRKPKIEPSAEPVESQASAARGRLKEVPDAAGSDDPRLTALKGHFELMNEFLASQSRVMSFLGVNTVQSAPPVQPQAQRPVETSREKFDEAWPFLGEVIEKDAEHLLCRRRFDIQRDVFLRHHTLTGGTLSDYNPELTGLPIIPFTVSLEIIAEAAAYLTGGGKYVTKIHDIRGLRFLALDQGTLDLNISARLMPMDGGKKSAAQVELFREAPSSGGARKMTIFEGKVELSDQPASSPPPFDFRIEQAETVHLSPGGLYSNGEPIDPRYYRSFHGPAFQCVKKVTRVGREGVEAELQALPKENIFVYTDKPNLQIDPFLQDSGGQLSSFWLSELFGIDINSYPFRLKALRQFGPQPAPGQKILCRASLNLIRTDETQPASEPVFEFLDEEGRVISRVGLADYRDFTIPDDFYITRLYPEDSALHIDIEFMDESGRVLSRAEGWNTRYISTPHHYNLFEMFPKFSFLTSEWTGDGPRARISLMEPLPPQFIEGFQGLWKRILVNLTLNENERRQWHTLPESESMRTQWLMGRIAAKEAARRWAQEKAGLKLASIDIEIETDAKGKPRAKCPALGSIALPDISISHSGGYAAGATAPENRRIGIDYQRLERVNTADLIAGGFTEAELSLLKSLAPDEKEGAAVGFWCAKEAVAKALGSGMEGEPSMWEVIKYSHTVGKAVISHQGDEYECGISVKDGGVLAVCII